jgi:sulfatase maturation enzyme AslB (radical SAM superfamily)
VSTTEIPQDIILKIIEPKLVQFGEVVLCLFENCNLSCVFCHQDHKAIEGMSGPEILSKVPHVIKYIRNSPMQDFHIHVMGGELFQDQLIQKGFLDHYSQMITQIQDQLPAGKRVTFNFITNLVLTETDLLLQFCQRHDLQINISYDPSGRFNQKNLEIFKNNVIKFQSVIKMASCVITRPNIKRVMAGDPTFEFLYQLFPIDWDSLIPSLENSVDLMPAESELLQFNKFLLDHFPECINVENFLSNEAQSQMRCTRGRSITIMPNNSSPIGCSGAPLLKHSNTKNLQTSEIVENFLAKYDCMKCEFYSKCPFTCFIKQDYKHLVNDLQTCVFKETFKYAKEKKKSSGASVGK